MTVEEAYQVLDEVMIDYKRELMEEFWRDSDYKYMPPIDPVEEFMDDVREMLYE
jgi:hypothetical protein